MDTLVRYNVALLGALKNVGLSQKALAEECGLPQSYISRFLNGKQIPTNGQAYQIADALGVEVDEIFKLE